MMLNTQKICPSCQQKFQCTGCGSGKCWCMDFPPIFSCEAVETASSSDNSSDCLCPTCLTAKTKHIIQQTVDTQAVHQYSPEKAKACQHLPLIDGLDYHVDEKGRWVLSRWYLLKRGECCGNGCLNCPYGHKNVNHNNNTLQ